MAADGEHYRPKRRSQSIENKEPLGQYGKRNYSMRQTEDHFGYDEGFEDTHTASTNVVRYNPSSTSALPRTTQQHTTASIQRRAKPASTELPAQAQQSQPRNTRSTRLPVTPIPPPPSTPPAKAKGGLFQRLKNMHWLFLVGLGMIVAIIIWMLGSSALTWGKQVYNNYRYGTPRTYQTDFVVGHKDSEENPSHFIAMNWNNQAVVIELPGGDTANMVSYVVPLNSLIGNSAEDPIILDFKDVNNDDKVDMIIQVLRSDQNPSFVFINEGDKFRASTNEDNIKL